MAGGKVYSFEEVRKHSDRKDCWLIIAGKVRTYLTYVTIHLRYRRFRCKSPSTWMEFYPIEQIKEQAYAFFLV